MSDKKVQKKVVTMAFVGIAFVTATVFKVLMTSAAAASGVIARFYAQDWAQHTLPVAIGIATFIGLQFWPKARAVGEEAVTELLKVVWPTKQDTVAMTTVVCVMLLISSLIIGFFDFLSTCLLYTSPSPRDATLSRMPSSA